MKRREVVARIEELGYRYQRGAKHGDLYKHQTTGVTIGLAGSPSDPNWFRQVIREAEAGAVTNGTGHLRFSEAAEGARSVPAAAEAILKASKVPMRGKEVIEAVLRARPESTRQAVSSGLQSRGKSRHSPIIRLDRGWYVYDEELAGLPEAKKAEALAFMASRGFRLCYRDPTLRLKALEGGWRKGASGAIMAEEIEVSEAPAAEVVGEPRKERPPETPSVAVTPSAPIFELVAQDGPNVAVIRAEDGRLWLARPLATVGVDWPS